MSKLVLDITMSLDGFIDGPNDTLERLHQWLFQSTDPRDRDVMAEYRNRMGAVLMGRTTFDDGVNKNGWGGWVDEPPFPVHVFVLSHDVPPKIVGNAAYTFVTEGIEAALTQARTEAGEKDVVIMGGANIAQQYLKAGLVDEIQLHLVPVLLGEGVRLFDHLGNVPIEMDNTRIIESPHVTHLRYRSLAPSED